MSRIDITNFWDRDMRNAINNNFIKLFNEYIGAGLNAEEARNKALDAVATSDLAKQTAEQANLTSEQVRLEMNNIIREQTAGGDIVPEVVSARGNEATLGERLNSTDANLAQTTDKSFYNSLVNHKERKALITWIDDDGHRGVYTKIAPLMREYGIKMTSAIITNRDHGLPISGLPAYDPNGLMMSYDEMKEIYSEGIVDFVCHTHTHDINHRLVDMTVEEMHTELKTNQDIIRQLGWNHRHLVYPFGAENPSVHNVVRQYFESAFDTTSGLVENPFNQFSIKRASMDGSATFEQIKPMIDQAVVNDSWLVITSHVDQYGGLDMQKARDVIEYAISQGLEFATIDEGLKQHGNLAQFGTTTISQNGEVYSDEIAVVKYGGLTGTKYAVNAPITDYPDNVIVEERVNYSNARLMNLERDTGLYDLAGVVETFSSSTSSYLYAYQKFTSTNHKRVFYRNWDSVNTNWSKWQSDQTVNIANLDYEINAPITAFPVRSFTYIKVRSMDALDYDLPGAGSIEVYRDSEDSYSYQKFTPVTRVGNGIKYRGWDITNNVWGKWNEVDGVEFTEIGDYPINAPITDFPIDKLIYLKVRLADASGYNLIRDTFVNGLYGKIEVHRDLEESYSYQKFISTGSNYEFYRKWDTSKNDWGNWGYNGITQYTKAEDYVVNAPMTDFPMNKITRLKVKSADAVGYGLSSGGIIEVYRDSENYYSYQKVISPRTNTVMYRYWIEPSLTWSDWQKPV